MNIRTALFLFLPLASLASFGADEGTSERDPKFTWVDGADYLQGRLTNGVFAVPYQRLPDSAWEVKGIERPLSVAKHGTGLFLTFKTASKKIRFDYTLKDAKEENNWCGSYGLYGIDVYTRANANDTWHWTPINRTKDRHALRRVWSVDRDNGYGEEYLVYLPFRGETRNITIGIDKNTTIESLPRPSRRVVHYGTSLVHGGCVTRAGLVFTSIYARKLDVEVVNLGFSGAAHLQLAIADLMAAETCELYVVDPALNNTADELRARLAPFVRRLRERRPDTPILVCEPANTFTSETDRSRATREVFNALVADGVKGLHLIKTDELMKPDGEGTVDGTHPNAYGAVQIGEGFARKIADILEI